MKTRARRAFSLVELMTVVGIIALLISILMPAMGRAREAGRRTVCLANLRSIAQGSIGYAANNNSQFPEWGQRIAGFTAIGQSWDWDGAIGSASDPGYAQDIRSNTRNVWMLVRGQAGDPKTFICPSDDEAGEAFVPGDVNHVYDVQNRSQFSYSFQYQGPALNGSATSFADTRTGWNTNLRDDSRLVIAADATPCMTPVNRAYTNTDPAATGHLFNIVVANDSALQAFVDAMDAMSVVGQITYNSATAKVNFSVPGSDTQRALNSANHRGEGQNVVRLDGSGEFSANPWAGAHFDNIYTVQDPTVYADPANLQSDAAQVVKDAVVRARMVGLYEGYAGYAGTLPYDEAGIMQAWVFNRASKSRFPDSFLVP